MFFTQLYLSWFISLTFLHHVYFFLAFFFMMFSVYGDTYVCSVQEAPAAVAAVASTAAGSLASGLMHDVGS